MRIWRNILSWKQEHPIPDFPPDETWVGWLIHDIRDERLPFCVVRECREGNRVGGIFYRIYGKWSRTESAALANTNSILDMGLDYGSFDAPNTRILFIKYVGV
jgi:hypothetical protein